MAAIAEEKKDGIGGMMVSFLQGDRMIWMVVIILFIFSMLAVYSATGTLAYRMQVGNEKYLMKQKHVWNSVKVI